MYEMVHDLNPLNEVKGCQEIMNYSPPEQITFKRAPTKSGTGIINIK